LIPLTKPGFFKYLFLRGKNVAAFFHWIFGSSYRNLSDTGRTGDLGKRALIIWGIPDKIFLDKKRIINYNLKIKCLMNCEVLPSGKSSFCSWLC
jgi:hypothetical protein